MEISHSPTSYYFWWLGITHVRISGDVTFTNVLFYCWLGITHVGNSGDVTFTNALFVIGWETHHIRISGDVKFTSVLLFTLELLVEMSISPLSY